MAWVLGLIGLYLVIVLVVAWVGLHPPRTPVFLSPAALGAPQEEVSVGRLRAWWVPAGREDAPVAILVHGYCMNRAELTPTAYRLWQEGYACLLVDLRGHGKSPSAKCTFGLEERHDVAACVKWVRERAPGAKIVLIGSSMGSAASALAVGEDPKLCDALVLDSCYSRLSGAILGWWRFLGGKPLMVLLYPTSFVALPLAGFNPFRVDISHALTRTGSLPILHLHGDRDTLALPEEATRNYEATPGPKRLVWFPGQGHSEFRWNQAEDYYAALLEFLADQGLSPR